MLVGILGNYLDLQGDQIESIIRNQSEYSIGRLMLKLAQYFQHLMRSVGVIERLSCWEILDKEKEWDYRMSDA